MITVAYGVILEHELARDRRIGIEGRRSGSIEIFIAQCANGRRGRRAVAPQQLERRPPGWTGSPDCGIRWSVRHWPPCIGGRMSRGRSNDSRVVGLSRSVLAERFAAMVGQPPMQYLALWRMQLASRLLQEGGSVAAIAAAVGYESEPAFSRAFKKLVGQTPAAWRRRAAQYQGPGARR